MESHPDELELLRIWASVLKNATATASGAAAIVRVGGLPILVKLARRYPKDVRYLSEAFVVLCNAGECADHVEDLADAGAPAIAWTVLSCKTMSSNAELASSCCLVLAAIFVAPSLRMLLREHPLIAKVIETMWMHANNDRLLAAAMLLVSRLTQEDNKCQADYLHEALEEKSRGVFAKSCVKFRDRKHVVLPAMAIFANLAREFTERTLLLEKDVPRLVVDLMRHYNEDHSVQAQGLRVLHMFCNDSGSRTAISKAGAITTTLVAVQKHTPVDEVMSLAMELLLQLVMDPSTRTIVMQAKIVRVLGTVLKEESGRPDLIQMSISMLAVLANHEDIHKDFMAENLKPTVEALMTAFRNNSAIQHDGAAAIQAAMPELLEKDTRNTTFPFKVVIVGKLSVGKTSLLTRACKNTFSPDVQSTIGVHIDYAKIEFPSHHVTLQVYDTAGEERFRSLTKSFYRGAHGAILVYDVSRYDSFEELESYVTDIKAAVPHDVQLLVVGTKIDLKDKHRVEGSQGRKFARAIGAKHICVSAVQNIGVHKAFRELTERLLRRWPAGPPSENNVKVDKVDEQSKCCF